MSLGGLFFSVERGGGGSGERRGGGRELEGDKRRGSWSGCNI